MWTWKTNAGLTIPVSDFTVRCSSAEDGAALVGGVVGGVCVEGLKALAARTRLDLPPPVIANKPLDGFLRISLEDESEILGLAAMIARRAALGSYWLQRNLIYAPPHFRIADADVVRAFHPLIMNTDMHVEQEMNDDNTA